MSSKVTKKYVSRTMTALTNVQIDRVFRYNNRYGGCLSKDEVPKVLGDKFYVINLADKDKAGTHVRYTYHYSRIYCLQSSGEV